MLSERTYPTPDSCLTHLFHGRGRSYCSLHCAGLVTPECTRGVIDPLYHSRLNDRDRQYECDRGIKSIIHQSKLVKMTTLTGLVVIRLPVREETASSA